MSIPISSDSAHTLAEVFEHALDRALPATLVTSHLDELAGKREGVGREAEGVANAGADPEHT